MFVTQAPHQLGHGTKLNFSCFFKPLQISETEKIGKFYFCVFQTFTLAEKEIWG